MDREEILARVLAFLDVLQDEEGETGRSVPDAGYVLDSLAVVQVVTFLEESFGLVLERSDLDFIDTPEGIVDLVLAKRSANG